MVTLPGQLAIKTIRGRNGPFNVGLLATELGEFNVKDAELDQYPEGKYEGDFTISRIAPATYTAGGRLVFELRARLAGMTLTGIDALSKEDSKVLTAQDVDPLDEETLTVTPVMITPMPNEAQAPIAVQTSDPTPAPLASDEVKSATPVPAAKADRWGKADRWTQTPEIALQEDEKLFGTLWPLGEVVKLDPTVGRRVLRQQIARLDLLAYEIDMETQTWHLKAA